jgi:hypothetical protein
MPPLPLRERLAAIASPQLNFFIILFLINFYIEGFYD